MNAFALSGVEKEIVHIKGDIRDLPHLRQVFSDFRPEIVIHMAAQPIVRDSYKDPVGMYSTNVMGTVNICEAVRQTSSVRSFVNVTTDKVYENKEKAQQTFDIYDRCRLILSDRINRGLELFQAVK